MSNNKTILVLVALSSIICNVQGALIPVGAAEAYTNIVDALNAANDYDILQLAPETFSGLGNHQIDLSNKSITIIGNSSVSTIIDCQNLGRAFFSLSNDSIDLVFQDLTFQNCNANGTYSNISASSVNLTAITGWGGVLALISNTTTVQFNNVQFIANYATRGSSLYIVSNSSVSIQNCYFFGNNATQGALYFIDTPFVNISDSQFINNRANQSGGAIWASGTTFSFMNTDFIGNSAPQGAGGAVIFTGNSEVVFQNCNFRNNTANNDGGAIYSNSGADLDVYDCLFDYNRGGQGGAISVNTFGGLDCYDSVFTNNVAGSWGGAMYIEQGYVNYHNTSVRFNYAGQGGGAASLWSEAEATLMTSNFTENNSPRGGAFFLQYGSILQVTNSFIEYNTADENGGGIYCSDSEIYLNESTALDNNVASSDASTDIYCAEDIPYTYCKVYGVTNFTDYCSMPDEGPAGTKQYDSLIIIGAVLVGSSFLVGCGSFVIYFLDPSHRKQQGFYWSAFKEEDNAEDNDAIPLPE